jgi:hypothetical protein
MVTCTFPAGSFVEGRFGGKEAWFPGRIARVHGNGTVDIHYDDGDKERAIDPASGRRVRVAGAPPYSVDAVPYAARPDPEATTVLVRVCSRERWQRALDELLALCDEAVRRSSLRHDATAECYESPIAREFVEGRLQLDDPLAGWMARERATGLLQGFVLCTTFTTWVAAEHFRWSAAAASTTAAAATAAAAAADAELIHALNGCARGGDPLDTGCVWPRVAELSLAGSLGCGAPLVGALLQRLRDGRLRSADGGRYDFVVLQATKNAAAFYERAGFRHVGAAARHFTRLQPQAPTAAAAASGDDLEVVAESVGDWVPFRHFEYVVGDVEPSCMMALRLGAAAAPPSLPSTATQPACVWAQAVGEEARSGGTTTAAESEWPALGTAAGGEGPAGAGAGRRGVAPAAGAGRPRTEALAARQQQELQQPEWFKDYLRTVVRENAAARAAARAAAAAGGGTKRKLQAGDGSRSGALMRMFLRAAAGGAHGASPAKKRKVNRHKKPKAPPQKTTMLSFFSRAPRSN